VVLSNIVYRRMKEKFPQFMEELEQKGVRYTRYLPDGDDHTSTNGRGWQSTYQTKDRKEAEARVAAQGASAEWQEDGSLKVSLGHFFHFICLR
jgi:hypothetical protein